MNTCPQGRTYTKVFGGILELLAERGFENVFHAGGATKLASQYRERDVIENPSLETYHD